MRARIHDPGGPAYTRLALPATVASLVLAVALIAGAAGMWRATAWLVGLVAVMMTIVMAQRPRYAPRRASLRVRAGRIEVEGARKLSSVIRARDVIAASVAAFGGGTRIVLVHRDRKARPLGIDVATEEEGRAVCRALGLGVHGFGVVRWRGECVQGPLLHAQLELRRLEMDVGRLRFRYADVERVEQQRGRVKIFAREGASVEFKPEDDAAFVASFLDARLRMVVPSSALAHLARAGESMPEWRARLDAMAPSVGGATYRQVPIDEDALWQTLEDPEAPADERAGAARILAHAPGRRVRVDEALASMREDEALTLAEALLEAPSDARLAK